MKILLTGATGYIGKRLLPALVDMGHKVVCGVRDLDRFHPPKSIEENIEAITLDVLKPETLENIPEDIDAGFYLIHSMAASSDYMELEKTAAINFRKAIEKTSLNHLVYLSGIVNEDELSEHLESRKNVEIELGKGSYNFTTLRAGIIIGSGSASFEIIRDLVEKLPVMVAPKWLNTKCQPIGVVDVVTILSQTIGNKETFNDNFDIAGPDILTYKEMLLGYAKVRGLGRTIITVPVMTPRLSSYWLYFVTSTSYRLATALVDSMKIEVVARDNRIEEILGLRTMSYRTSLERALSKIDKGMVASSWKDSYSSSGIQNRVSDHIEVPSFGCFKDQRSKEINNREKCIEKIWQIGGKNGWYYGDFLWKVRGYLDLMVGGVGLRRGRTNENSIQVGDALDFWRVLYANKEQGRLILFAEMKLPGEAWLEFNIKDNKLVQTATFRPKGLMGRLYWYSVYVFHGFIFEGLLRELAS
ncbi:MAG: SDR family oxidoreductase [Flavobacteriaceae bacterium]|nr:SDR family oxidoreductase [Flavobacteriaceae bacterium]